MLDRREFIRCLTAFGVLTQLGQPLLGGPPSLKPSAENEVYTARVRRVTARLKIARNRWRMIIVHHSATKNGNAAIFDRMHRKRGMENGLAYHFLIGNGTNSGDGEIEIGNRWLKQLQGGHVRSEEVNAMAIGICLVGNFEESHPTKRQLAAFHELMGFLRVHVTGRKVRVITHGELDPGHTACPGRNFPKRDLHRRYR